MKVLKSIPTNSILLGDALEQLRRLPAAAVDAVVTSPPYFLLRRYDAETQIGLEDSVSDYVTRIVDIITELRRVLVPTGSIWLNLGDSYSRHHRYGAPAKSMLLAPERIAIALVDSGLCIRNKVTWAKPNPMPTSVRDRLSCTWEPMFHITLQGRYFYDLDAIRVPHLTRPRVLTPHRRHAKSNVGTTKYTGSRPQWAGPLAGSNDGLVKAKAAGQVGHPKGKNPGDCWSIATAGFGGDHPAVFPARLVERPIQATCPERVCLRCAAPWSRAEGGLQPTCRCRGGSRPGIVLDPFMGAGTTAVVAEALRRDWLGIELSPKYRTLALDRITAMRERSGSQTPAPSRR